MQRLYSKSLANISTVNISVIGMNGSGKSAVVVKYLTRRYIVEYAPYLNDSYTKPDSVDGQELIMNIQDTSDSDEIDLDDIIKWSQAIIILFSMTSRRSFYRAQELVEAIKQLCDLSDRKTGHHQRLTSTSSQSFLPSSGSASPNLASPTTPSLAQHSPGQTGSLRRAAIYTISTTKPPILILTANKLDLERFRLVEKNEAEDFAKIHSIPYFEITVTESYKEIQTIFHTAARLFLQSKSPKQRTANNGSMCNSTGKGILPGVSLTAGNSASVLTSLAVSPSLLLQKKPAQNNSSNISFGNVDNLSPNQDCDSLSSSSSTSYGTSSILSNFKLRTTSPPTTTNTALRSSSPAWFNTPQSTNNIRPPGSTTQSTNQSPTSNITNQLIGSSTSPTKLPQTTSTAIATTTTSTTTTHKPHINTSKSTSNSSDQTAAVTTSNKPTLQPSQLSAPSNIPAKKQSMGFKFFSKKK